MVSWLPGDEDMFTDVIPQFALITLISVSFVIELELNLLLCLKLIMASSLTEQKMLSSNEDLIIFSSCCKECFQVLVASRDPVLNLIKWG